MKQVIIMKPQYSFAKRTLLFSEFLPELLCLTGVTHKTNKEMNPANKQTNKQIEKTKQLCKQLGRKTKTNETKEEPNINQVVILVSL